MANAAGLRVETQQQWENEQSEDRGLASVTSIWCRKTNPGFLLDDDNDDSAYSHAFPRSPVPHFSSSHVPTLPGPRCYPLKHLIYPSIARTGLPGSRTNVIGQQGQHHRPGCISDSSTPRAAHTRSSSPDRRCRPVTRWSSGGSGKLSSKLSNLRRFGKTKSWRAKCTNMEDSFPTKSEQYCNRFKANVVIKN